MRITRIKAQKSYDKTRIAVYCRVSKDLETQEDSLETQREAYTELVSLRSDWELVGVYADSLSGLSAEKRPKFMKMIDDALAGRIDRILCKSVSRFSRNVAECKKYTDLLRTRNVTVEFEKENLRTDDPTSSFIFSLMSAIAENESRSISENIQWGYRERYKRGEFNLGNNRILGYDTVDGKLVPNQYADAVRLIYALFLEGKTVEEIIRTLTGIGVKNRKGAPLNRNTIIYILKNETYKGDKLLQKQPPRNFITKKPDPKIPYESNYLTDDHEPIVSRDVWDAAQAKLEENKKIEEVVGHRGGQPHFLYGKVFCGECGAPMTRRTVNGPGGMKIKTWICREKRKGSGCKGRNVKEDELLAVSESAMKIVVNGDGIAVE
jgi:DNA invertase Pin-like site-specific DNA recombinase